MTILPQNEASARLVVVEWNGARIRALQQAFRMTQEEFAAHLGVSVRGLATWRAQPDFVPRSSTQQILDVAYERADEETARRFVLLVNPEHDEPVRLSVRPPADTDRRVAEMAADMALMQARIDMLQEKLGALALRFLS
ncbi:hypothetical protein ACFVU4_27875 [Streptomyces sp. NPDC058107]|uniref:hypothetical protein n=1 Tax=Streptomyces sp. NPDC058107 TaxID=3346343 RepID=UPI0036EA584C